MTDAQQIYNLEHDVHKVPKQYLSANWNYLQDVQNGQYSNQIAFNTTSTKANLTDLHNAFITIPMGLSVTGSTSWPSQNGTVSADFEAPWQPPNIAFKQSVLDLIGNLQVATDNGSVILNETNTNLINNLRLLLEHDENWFFANADRLGAWPDQFDDFHAPCAQAAWENGNQKIYPITNGTNGVTSIGYQTGINAPTGTNNSQTAIGQWMTGGVPVNLEPITNDPNEFQTSFSVPATNNSNPAVGSLSGTADTAWTNGSAVTITGVTLSNAVNSSQTSHPLKVLTDRNLNYNKGFGKRIGIFRSTLQNPGFTYNFLTTSTTSGVQNTSQYIGWHNPTGQTPALTSYISYIAVIPLKLLHDFFMQMNFPIINWGLVITLYLNQTGGISGLSQTQYPPFMTDSSAGNTTADTYPGGTITTPAPAITYANGLTAVGSPQGSVTGPYSTCRLWYRAVQLEGTENRMFSEALLKGYKKRFKFISTDVIRSRNQGATGTGQTGNLVAYTGGAAPSLNETITTSIVQPIRCWVLMTPTGHYSRSDYASGVCPARLSDVQVQIANLNYFPTPINPQDVSPEQWWTLWKEQQDPAHPSMINYSHFINSHTYMCLDVSRLSNRLPSATLPTSVQIQASRADKNPYAVDVWYLFERWNEISIDFSNNGVNIVVGNVTTGA